MALRDSSAQLTVLVDRAVGAGSIADGELEVMIHRRILCDDGRGVGEPLNETSATDSYASPTAGAHTGSGLVIRGKHRLSLEAPDTAARFWRPLADRAYSPPQLLFHAEGGVGGVAAVVNVASFANALPSNVQLMTLQALSPTSLLLRLSHQFGIDEDAKLSAPVMVDIVKMLAPAAFKITEVREVSLTNTQDKSALLARRADNAAWNIEGEHTSPHPWRSRVGDIGATNVTLGPLEIKTFVITHA